MKGLFEQKLGLTFFYDCGWWRTAIAASTSPRLHMSCCPYDSHH